MSANPSDRSPLRPVIASAASTVAIRPFGLEMKVLIDSEDTGGNFSALLVVHQPGEGPPPHMHDEQHEFFYVLAGEYTLSVDGVTQVVGPDTMVSLPAKCVHGFTNTGKVAAKMLDWSLPGGQDHMFREIHAAANALDAQAGGFKEAMMTKTADVNRKYKTTYFPK